MPRTTKLFIPDKVAVGFKEREGTYTGKLAYVIYYDKKGVLRKERSWQSWRDSKIKPEEFDNVPTEGFVLNKGVGGTRNSYGWNPRNEYIRVYDPRGFEFEISVPNLLFILKECDCSRGKGLEGEFVYSWDKSELVLVPVSSMDYKLSQEFTDFKEKSVKVKELVDGATYTTKNMEDIVYVGRFEYHFAVSNRWSYRGARKKDGKGFIRKFVFWNGEKFLFTENVRHLAVCKTEVPPGNYAELVDQFHNSKNGTKVVRLFLKKKRKKDDDPRYPQHKQWWFENEDGQFVRAHGRFQNVKTTPRGEPGGYELRMHHVETLTQVFIDKDGITKEERFERASYPNDKARQIAASKSASGWSSFSSHYNNVYTNHPDLGRWVEPTEMDLWVELESGKKFKYDAISHSGA